MPLVSVIIPTRNRDAYLREAIDSVYAQHFQDFEIIVIDDGGSGSAGNAVAMYDERLRYVHQPHAGAAAARNRGIKEARGEFIAFLDDDDLFFPSKLKDNIAFMDQHPDVVWLCSGFAFIDSEGKSLPREPIIPSKSEVTLHDIAMFTFIDTSSVMVRKANIVASGGFPEGVAVSEDYDAWAGVLATGKGAALKQCLVCFRQHAGNSPLPYKALYRENIRIIDKILSAKPSGCLARSGYIDNLQKIIKDTLLYRRKYLSYISFFLHTRIIKVN